MDETYRNELGQPVGKPLPGWKAAKPFLAPVLEGRHCRLEPLSAAHAPDLFDAYALDAEGRNWTYLPYGPFGTLQTYETWLAGVIGKPDPAFMAVISLETRKPVGVGSFMRMDLFKRLGPGVITFAYIKQLEIAAGHRALQLEVYVSDRHKTEVKSIILCPFRNFL